MTRNPATVNLRASVHEVARVMRTERIGSVIIIEEGRLSGIITERDLVRKVFQLLLLECLSNSIVRCD